jgi:hypothetical protein
MIIINYNNIKTLHPSHVECKKKIDASNNRGNLNNLKIIQKIPGKHGIKESRKQPYWALHTYFGKY